MNAFLTLFRADVPGVVGRRWYWGTLAAGALAAIVVVLTAAGGAGQDQLDGFQAGGAAVVLLAGLVVALGLGATAFWGDIQSGSLGVSAAAGASRATLAVARVASRVVLLGAALFVWTLLLVVGGAIVGVGFDGAMVVHGLAQYETLGLTMLATCAASTVLGPWSAGIVGLMVNISAQAAVNLSAAADAGRLGTANRVVQVVHNMLPHSIVSPMAASLQNRAKGGPAAPQFEINSIPVAISPSGVGSVLWTLAWCLFFVWLCFVGLRRRNLN